MQSKKIEDVYPLSPMQQGMLFHSLLTPETGVYLGQMCYELQGNLDVDILKLSWQQAINRHPALKTAFAWEKLEKPIQVVGSQVTVPFEFHDWRSLSVDAQAEKLLTWLEKDRHQDFQLSKAPLLRLTLIQISQNNYRLILTHHHLVLDGWSLPLLFAEVINVYQSCKSGQPINLPRPRPYRDYISWLQKQEIATARQYWQQLLQGFTIPTSFALDHKSDRPASQEKSYAKQHLQLSIAETIACQSLAKQHRLTLNTIIQGVWALLLHRYSSEVDVVFGSTSSGRPADLVGSEAIVGNLINTLPVRVAINPKDLIIPWLQQLQTQQLESRQYEYSPLSEIQKWSEVPQGIPLFESIVVFENYPTDDSLQQRIGDFTIRKINSVLETNYPLTIASGVRPEFYLDVLYDNQRFDDAAITRMLGHLQTLLLGIIANCDRSIGELPLLTTKEEYRLLIEWNATEADYPLDKCIHQLFEAQAAKTPDAVAVIFEDSQLTYQELNSKANQLADYLQQNGVKSEILVGICLDRSLEMVISLLAVLKAGGAYIPLDPSYPPERLQFMVEDSNLSILLTQEKLLDRIPNSSAKIICLDRDSEIINLNSSLNLVNAVTPNNLAYVIYTSGSTGQPKGVMISHRALCNHMLWMQKEFAFTSSDRILQKTPFSFDASVWEFYAPLLVGGTLVLAKPDGQQEPDYLIQLIIEKQVTILQLVPSLLRVLLDSRGASRIALTQCQSLRRVFCGGENLSRELQQRFYQQLNHCELYNLYGPTEATIDTTYYLCPRQPQPINSIGKPISNAQVYILDDNLQPVAIGIPGEIYIGGVGVARGYLNQPELTKEKFLEVKSNNYSLIPQFPTTLLYKTGDKARYLPNGNIEFLGRIDNQVKLRGFRIELGEIETQLEQHPQVKQAVVQVREDEPNTQRLVAYYVAKKANKPKSKELRSYLQKKLPQYMIPGVFVALELFPLTPSGKIDRHALPIPEITTGDRELTATPRNQIESTLVNIWQEVLQVDNIGIYDNFFELGGDSILSLQVIAKAKSAGIQLTPKQIFQYQTIAELETVASKTTTEIAQQGLVTGVIPLIPIQQRFFAQKFLDLHHWNQSVILEVQNCDRHLLEQAIQNLWEHHDLLRAKFIKTDSGWQGEIPVTNYQLPVISYQLSEFSENRQKQEIEAIASQLQSSFNLTEGQLIKIIWFDLGKEKSSRLLIIAHHLIIDGVSWRILLEDLETAYRQLSQGETVKLPAKTTSYKDWAQQLQKYAQSDKVKEELDYWLSLKAPLSKGSRGDRKVLPLDFPEGDNTVASAATVSVTLTPEETQALLTEVPSAYQTQINDVLLTALAQTFQKWTSSNSLLIELEGHGREDILDNIDLSRTVGWFTTIFPVLLDLGTNSDPEAAIKTIKEQLRSIPQKGINYGVLRYLNNDEKIREKLEKVPQAEVRFNYLGQTDQITNNSSLFQPATESTGNNQSLRGHRDCVIEINSAIADGKLFLDWTYSKTLHRESTIQQLADGFIEKLRSLISHCQCPDAVGYTPSDFPQMEFDAAELDLLLSEIN